MDSGCNVIGTILEQSADEGKFILGGYDIESDAAALEVIKLGRRHPTWNQHRDLCRDTAEALPAVEHQY